MSSVLVGLDLSLCSSGICVLPFETWDCDPAKCHVKTVTHKRTPRTDTERAERLSTMARQTIATAREMASGQGITAWTIESLPTHGAFATVPLGELHGVLRYLLHEQGQTVVTCPQSAGRRLLLGHLPRKDVKTIVAATVRSFPGCAGWGSDEVDSFCCANWLASESGFVALAA